MNHVLVSFIGHVCVHIQYKEFDSVFKLLSMLHIFQEDRKTRTTKLNNDAEKLT